MDDRPSSAVDRLVCALDQLRARLRQDRDRDVVRNQAVLDEQPHEVEVRLRRRREAHLDLLEAELAEEREEALLACSVHRVNERLVAVS